MCPCCWTTWPRWASQLNFAGEWRHQRKDGTVFPVQVISHALVHNGRFARLVVCQDVTEQKRIEAERTNSFQRNQALVRALGEIVYEWSTNRQRCTLWDGDLERILGYSAAEMGHTAADWEDKIHPDDRDWVRQESLSAAIREQRNLNIEYRFRQKDGDLPLDAGSQRGAPNEQGELEKVVGVYCWTSTSVRDGRSAAPQRRALPPRHPVRPGPGHHLCRGWRGAGISQAWLGYYRLHAGGHPHHCRLDPPGLRSQPNPGDGRDRAPLYPERTRG
jgi:PAS domain-containing protein